MIQQRIRPSSVSTPRQRRIGNMFELARLLHPRNVWRSSDAHDFVARSRNEKWIYTLTGHLLYLFRFAYFVPMKIMHCTRCTHALAAVRTHSTNKFKFNHV